jgi:hypothetical protein
VSRVAGAAPTRPARNKPKPKPTEDAKKADDLCYADTQNKAGLRKTLGRLGPS